MGLGSTVYPEDLEDFEEEEKEKRELADEENGEERTEEEGTVKRYKDETTDEEAAVRTWRDSLPEISEILEACLEEAHAVLCRFADGAGTRLPSIDSTVKLADSMFSAVVTAEAGRRQAELQKQIGQQVSIPILGPSGRQGWPIPVPPPGGKRG